MLGFLDPRIPTAPNWFVMINFSRNKTSTNAMITLLLFVMLSMRIGGAVGHYCFDGLEPPVTVHFDNFSGHQDHEHEHETGHNDVEKQLLVDNLLSKVFEYNSHPVISSALSFSLRSQTRSQSYGDQEVRSSHTPYSLLPPLRAPPLIS